MSAFNCLTADRLLVQPLANDLMESSTQLQDNDLMESSTQLQDNDNSSSRGSN